jgi:hypothetical protein
MKPLRGNQNDGSGHGHANDICTPENPLFPKCLNNLKEEFKRTSLPPSDSKSLYMGLYSYEQSTSKNTVKMEIESQVKDGNPKNYRAIISTSSSEFALMTTDCVTTMC